MDPRPTVVGERLADVGRVVAVSGGKGGTGKSVVASTLALTLAERGLRAGLLDLDFTGPCDHLILGAETGFPDEEFGVDPPVVHGVAFMSVTHFVADHPAPLRGPDISNALLELLAITRWGSLDVLVIDMPPGLGDATLDTVRWLKHAEYLAVATGSRVVLETVRKMLRLHAELGTRVAGLIENMQHSPSGAARELAAEFGLPHLGALPRDETLEEALGDPARLSGTPFATALREVSDRLFTDTTDRSR